MCHVRNALLCWTEFALCFLRLILYPKTLQVWHPEMGPALYSHLQAVESPAVREPSELMKVWIFQLQPWLSLAGNQTLEMLGQDTIRDMSWRHQKAEMCTKIPISSTTYRQILLLNPSHK